VAVVPVPVLVAVPIMGTAGTVVATDTETLLLLATDWYSLLPLYVAVNEDEPAGIVLVTSVAVLPPVIVAVPMLVPLA